MREANKLTESCAGIYPVGGQTEILRLQIFTTGVHSLLCEAFNRDVPIYGGSAGAILLGKWVPGHLDASSRKIGLNVIGGYSVHCHANVGSPSIPLTRDPIIPYISIPEDGGVVFHNKTWQMLGSPSLFINLQKVSKLNL